jgi:hypothetical protein
MHELSPRERRAKNIAFDQRARGRFISDLLKAG